MFLSREILNQGQDATRAYIEEKLPSFGGAGKPNDPYYTRTTSEPLSDSIPHLKHAIKKHVRSTDIVLSTPKHLGFFHGKARKIIGYDISPAQLEQERNMAREFYWCNLGIEVLTQALFEQTQPTVLYMSNIHEYLLNREKSALLNEIENLQSLRVVIFSRLARAPLHIDDFAGDLSRRGWNMFEYPAQGTKEYMQIMGETHVAQRE